MLRLNMYSFVRWSVIFDLLIVDGVDIYCNLFQVRFKGECGVELHILKLVNIALDYLRFVNRSTNSSFFIQSLYLKSI